LQAISQKSWKWSSFFSSRIEWSSLSSRGCHGFRSHHDRKLYNRAALKGGYCDQSSSRRGKGFSATKRFLPMPIPRQDRLPSKRCKYYYAGFAVYKRSSLGVEAVIALHSLSFKQVEPFRGDLYCDYFYHEILKF
jgi:hypothetical protein